MRSGNFTLQAGATTLAAMSSQVETSTRAENSADLLRILVALGLLALLASFDGANDAAAAPPANVATGADQSQ